MGIGHTGKQLGFFIPHRYRLTGIPVPVPFYPGFFYLYKTLSQQIPVLFIDSNSRSVPSEKLVPVIFIDSNPGPVPYKKLIPVSPYSQMGHIVRRILTLQSHGWKLILDTFFLCNFWQKMKSKSTVFKCIWRQKNINDLPHIRNIIF